jgi:hypothetical protein
MNFHTEDILLCAMAHLWDDNNAQLPDVEKPLYAATGGVWKEYEATDTMLALASRCLVLMYKVAICYPST